MIISIGSINADFQVRTGAEITPGQTQFGTDFVRLGGGKAANVAFLAHLLGKQTMLIARVGDDELREQALAPLRRAGIAFDHVSTAPGQPTSVSMIAVPPSGKKTIILANNANDAWDEPAIKAALAAIQAAPPGSMLVADYEITPDAATRAILAAAERGMPILLDPAPSGRVDVTALSRCDAISPDAFEAGEMAGFKVDTPESAARAALALAARGPRLVCVKLSEGGCVFAEAGRVLHVPPVQVTAVDATGAGDAFTGALAVALSEGRPTEQAVLFAAAASHLAVMRYGSQEAYRGREETEQLVPRLEKGMRRLAG